MFFKRLLSREGATVKPFMCTPGGADGISVNYLFKNFIVSCMYLNLCFIMLTLYKFMMYDETNKQVSVG